MKTNLVMTNRVKSKGHMENKYTMWYNGDNSPIRKKKINKASHTPRNYLSDPEMYAKFLHFSMTQRTLKTGLNFLETYQIKQWKRILCIFMYYKHSIQ